MYTPEDIQQQFDAATLAYLQNKTRGGDSGQKGTRYEDYFAVYKLTQLAQDILEAGLIAQFYSQICAFVDDLIIDIDAQPLQHYQLKNSPTVSWNAGQHPIQSDFASQERLNRTTLNRGSDLSLVVSDSACAERLTATIPKAIAPFSQVLYFPKPSPLLDWLEQVPDWKQAIAYLSAFEHPAPDKIEYVVKALMGAWMTRQTASALEVLTAAQQQSPQYIRSFQPDLALDVEVATILGNIPDFRYSLTKGFLHWEYANGLDSGTPPYSVDTDAFRRLQERIKERNPTTFEELENLL